jgi:hypothetical protein
MTDFYGDDYINSSLFDTIIGPRITILGSTEKSLDHPKQLFGDFLTIDKGENDNNESLPPLEDLLRPSRLIVVSRSGRSLDEGQNQGIYIRILNRHL